MSESASTTSGASVLDDKTATVQYKPATSLAGNNNALAHYEQSPGYDQISHALSNIHGLYGWSCNLLDVISVYSLYRVSCQAVSPTNGLGTRLGGRGTAPLASPPLIKKLTQVWICHIFHKKSLEIYWANILETHRLSLRTLGANHHNS